MRTACLPEAATEPDPAAREAEIARRRRGRNHAVLVLLLLFALLLYGLAMVRLGG